MAITDSLVLPADVLLTPVRELEAEVRARLDCSDDDFAVTRPRGRPTSVLIEGSARELVELFRSPQRIVDAIVQYSARSDADPEEALKEAFPLLRTLYASHLLVEEGSDQSAPIEPLFSDGATVEQFRIERCIQALDDSDVYQVGQGTARFALKIARDPGNSTVARALDYERRVLEFLDGERTPRVIASGQHNSRQYLVLEWYDAVNALMVSHEYRRRGTRADLHRLCTSIADSYAFIHQKGVTHGDVHPQNVLVLPDGSIRLVDFGLAQFPGAPGGHDWPRGGVAYFFEPEYAKAVLTRQRRPQATPLGEQYGLAALMYLLFTGSHYLDFSIERKRMMRQICDDAPLSFASRRVEPWPAIEAVLAKAMRKAANVRHASIPAFADALRTCLPRDDYSQPRPRTRTREVVVAALREAEPQGRLFLNRELRAPKCSINYGAAGVAYFWYRLSLLHDEARYLAHADLWCNLASSLLGDEGAFYNPAIAIHEHEIGPTSLFHTATGVHCVQSLVSHAFGEFDAVNAAVRQFVAAAEQRPDTFDLVLGQGSLLLGCATMLEALSVSGKCDVRPLTVLGDQLAAALHSHVAGRSAIVAESNDSFLAIAHGWAGLLYALLRWDDVSGSASSETSKARLVELAALARGGSAPGSSWWPRRLGDHSSQLRSSWCSGAAGFVFLWLQAHDHFPEEGFASLAERAALTTYDDVERNASICCGLAGRAYALAAFYRFSSSPVWLSRAHELCDLAAADEPSADASLSLFKGRLGVALVAAELEQPAFARLPLFEPQGWQKE